MTIDGNSSLLILGRQPALGLAEIESLYGASSVRRVGRSAALVAVDPCRLTYERLGGSVKFCKILSALETTNWDEIVKFLVKVAPAQSQKMPSGKMHLGLSAVDFKLSPAKVNASGLTIKKAITQTGRSVRLVPNKASELSSAQIIHNKLLTENGWELVIVRNGNQTIVAQSIKVQDIASYSLRDRGRPKRDAKVGMLPPKLAQIIINLASGQLPLEKLQNICEIPAGQPIPAKILDKIGLDPFCGTGVILQEAVLMGYGASGSDLDARMVDYSRQNLEWLAANYKLETTNHQLASGDATSYKWPTPIDFVASETYLGRPFTSAPTTEMLAKTASECNLIIKKFLANIAGQLASGTRLALAVPAWQVAPGKFKHLPLVDQIEDLGYNRISFEHAQESELIYFREQQIVARQLLVITRK